MVVPRPALKASGRETGQASTHLPQAVHFSFTKRGLTVTVATASFAPPETLVTSARVRILIAGFLRRRWKLISRPQVGGHIFGK